MSSYDLPPSHDSGEAYIVTDQYPFEDYDVDEYDDHEQCPSEDYYVEEDNDPEQCPSEDYYGEEDIDPEPYPFEDYCGEEDIDPEPYPFEDDYGVGDIAPEPYPFEDDYGEEDNAPEPYPFEDDYGEEDNAPEPYPFEDDYGVGDIAPEPYPFEDDYGEEDIAPEPYPFEDYYVEEYPEPDLQDDFVEDYVDNDDFIEEGIDNEEYREPEEFPNDDYDLNLEDLMNEDRYIIPWDKITGDNDTQSLIGPSERISIRIDDGQDNNTRDHEAHTRGNTGWSYRKVDIEKKFVIANFIVELPSAVFDQLSSVHKPQYALLSMLMSFVAMVMCIAELVYKARKENFTWKWRSKLPWLYYLSRRHKPFGNFKDIVGLVCAFCQCIFATITFMFARRHADNPINISVWPIVFAFGLLCSKFSEKQQRSGV